MTVEIASPPPPETALPLLRRLAGVEGASRLKRWVIFRNLGIRLRKITLAPRLKRTIEEVRNRCKTAPAAMKARQ